MADNQQGETSEQQKRSIAPFIIGLAIGGVLIWIFAANSGDKAKTPTTTADNNTTSGNQIAIGDNATGTPVKISNVTVTPVKSGMVVSEGNGAVSVDDQKAGMTVTIKNVTYPAKAGWIVVKEEVNGKVGNALGAARWGGGLDPRTIDLLRGTKAGGTYHVVLYTEDGDKIYNPKLDKPFMSGGNTVEATFKAN